MCAAVAYTAGCDVALAKPMAAKEACAQNYITLSGRVVDEAGILDAAEESRLSERLAALEQKSGHQFVVATVTSLQGKSIEAYSLCLANHWGIGRAKVDDGVVLLVAPVERKVRIEVGYGLESELTDAEAHAILETRVLPEFRGGRLPKGIEDGATAIIAEVQ